VTEIFSVIATKSVVNNVPPTPLVMSDGDATVRQGHISAEHRTSFAVVQKFSGKRGSRIMLRMIFALGRIRVQLLHIYHLSPPDFSSAAIGVTENVKQVLKRRS
jgi:hypothetical protein